MGIFQLLKGFKKKIFRTDLILKGPVVFGKIATNMVKEEFFWIKKQWPSLVKKPATVDIKKTKHLKIITDPTTTSPSEAVHLAPYRDKID